MFFYMSIPQECYVRLFFVFGTLFVQATRLFDGARISEADVKKYSGCITEITCPNNSAPFNSCYYLAFF